MNLEAFRPYISGSINMVTCTRPIYIITENERYINLLKMY